MNVESPFSDVDDIYITTAYNLKIVSGVGNNKFAPENYITRQEAAVMINNLATILNIDKNKPQTKKFVDKVTLLNGQKLLFIVLQEKKWRYLCNDRYWKIGNFHSLDELYKGTGYCYYVEIV